MWLLPTFGRPHLFDGIFDAPGGMPPPSALIVYLTAGDAAMAARPPGRLTTRLLGSPDGMDLADFTPKRR